MLANKKTSYSEKAGSKTTEGGVSRRFIDLLYSSTLRVERRKRGNAASVKFVTRAEGDRDFGTERVVNPFRAIVNNARICK